MKRFTIGEVSKIVNVPVRTLHYYDEIGLFKPAEVDAATNYRYYSEEQIGHIDLIKSLKYIGTSLADIKRAQHYTPEQLLAFLQTQEAVIAEKMRRMQDIQDVLLRTQKQLEEQINIPCFNEPYVSSEDAQQILTIDTTEATLIEVPSHYFSALTYAVENEGSVLSNRYGATYALKPYERAEDFRYDNLFTPLLTDHLVRSKRTNLSVDVIPAGDYLCIAFPYGLDTYVDNYKRLYNYIQVHGVAVASSVYEVFLPTHFSPNEEMHYVVELKVKIISQ